MKTLDDIYRETLYRTTLTTNDLPYVYASGGAYGFLQLFADKYVYLCQQVIDCGSDYFLESGTKDISNGIIDYYAPSDLVKLRYMEVSYDGVTWYKARQTKPQFFPTSELAFISAQPQSTPAFWPLGTINAPSSHFKIAPSPTANVTDGIKLYYDRIPSALFASKVSAAVSAASAVVNFPQQFDWLLPLGCAVELWGKYGQRAEKADEIARYDRGIEDMRKALDNRMNSGPKRMRDVHEVESYYGTDRNQW